MFSESRIRPLQKQSVMPYKSRESFPQFTAVLFFILALRPKKRRHNDVA